MTSDRHNLVPPFVWPELDVRGDEHRILDPLPYGKLIASATSMFGIVYGLNQAGVERLDALLRRETGLQCRLLIAVGAACPTQQQDLERLSALEKEFLSRMTLRLQPLDPTDVRPSNVLCCVTTEDPEGFFFSGPSSNFGSVSVTSSAINFVWRCDAALREAYCKWFDSIWKMSPALTAETIAIPALAPARGTMEASEMWRSYIEACRASNEANTVSRAEETASAEQAGDASPKDSAGQAKKSATEDIGIPRLNEIAEKLARVLNLGFQVTIDKNTRIPPLDAPIKPEWFGVQSLRQIGAVSRRVEYRVSVISERTLKDLSNKKQKTRTLLNILSFPLSEAVRWMPQRAFALFEAEMNRVNAEGQELLKKALTDNPQALIDAQRDTIYNDANLMYQDFHSGRNLPKDVFEKILTDLNTRLQKASVGQLLPKVSRLRIQFKFGTGSQWESEWGQALTFLYGVAEFPRMSLTDSFYLRGLRSDKDEILEAMNVCDDSILSARNNGNVEKRAKEELVLLNEIMNAQVDTRTKCEAILDLLAGVGKEKIKEKLDENLKEPAPDAVLSELSEPMNAQGTLPMTM